jgi:hypothetical protein
MSEVEEESPEENVFKEDFYKSNIYTIITRVSQFINLHHVMSEVEEESPEENVFKEDFYKSNI